jgi:hypothetical protein
MRPVSAVDQPEEVREGEIEKCTQACTAAIDIGI